MDNLRDSMRCFNGVSPPIPTCVDHDVFVLAGDLNTRLDLPGPDAKAQVHAHLHSCWDPSSSSADVSSSQPGWRALLRYDQFQGLASYLRSLGMTEGQIRFPPTYKMQHEVDAYNSERAPAWCDRVLYKSAGSRTVDYRAVGSLRGSDHRAVCALLEATLLGSPSDRAKFEALEPRPRKALAATSSRALPTPRGIAKATGPASQEPQTVDMGKLEVSPQAPPLVSPGRASRRSPRRHPDAEAAQAAWGPTFLEAYSTPQQESPSGSAQLAPLHARQKEAPEQFS